MKKSTLVILLLLSVYCEAAKGPGELSFPQCKETLTLNGTGKMVRYFIDMYTVDLYLSRKSREPDKIIESKEAMDIRLNVISGLITPSRMEKAVRDGFNHSTGGHQAPIQTGIDELVRSFCTDIESGDIFDLLYVPERNAICVIKNGKEKATISGGLEFKKALFGIWLCKDPVDEDVKKSMLGE